ncbi:hypothetical protein FNH05_04870 [Amycolatopsis rhizosphaerae]|uniref:Uncharacterized protein n=1 Tax=Amycolatopsis rhizosphaerae TaxID=2053003 RepID=A0A558DGG2_9PSEU|nr:hypothetical protein [Amycolatopsis rhizosphaerae]TVT60114.1 hypothetical protein FNH05_04870 [Amycolatopsis rhizosphaerae]
MTVSVVGAADGGDELRALRSWLVAEDEFRGRVRLITPPPEPGKLGAVTETLAIALGPGGAATVLAGALITWIRRQRGKIKLKVSRPDGTSVELSADIALDGEQARQLVTDLLHDAVDARGRSLDKPGSRD